MITNTASAATGDDLPHVVAQCRDGDREQDRREQRRERRLVQQPRDDEPHDREPPTTINGYNTTSAPPAAATPLPPLR